MARLDHADSLVLGHDARLVQVHRHLDRSGPRPLAVAALRRAGRVSPRVCALKVVAVAVAAGGRGELRRQTRGIRSKL